MGGMEKDEREKDQRGRGREERGSGRREGVREEMKGRSRRRKGRGEERAKRACMLNSYDYVKLGCDLGLGTYTNILYFQEPYEASTK